MILALCFLNSGSIWGCPGLHFGLIFSNSPSIQATKVGTAECAERLNSPYPARGAGVLNPVQKSMPYRESLPLLTSPPGSAETVVPKGGPEVGLFFRFVFRFFGARKNGQKNGPSKNRLFPEIFAIVVPPTSFFGHSGAQNGCPEGTHCP